MHHRWKGILAALTLWSSLVSHAEAAPREQLIPILSVTTDQVPTGSVLYLKALFEQRADHAGLSIRFAESPGRFSAMAMASAERAIKQAAAALELSTDSWSIELQVPYDGVTVSGDSLSAMVGVSISAMAQGKTISAGHVLTGTLTDDGAIGPVGAVPLKVQAARFAKLRRVLVPHQQAVSQETDRRIPARVEIAPVRSVPEALDALTR